jgi:hypothetical protein
MRYSEMDGAAGLVGGGFSRGFGTVLAAGATVNCMFNVSAGSGRPPQGTLYAEVAISTNNIASSTGNVAQSAPVQLDFNSPSMRWELGGCVQFTVSATPSGSAGG